MKDINRTPWQDHAHEAFLAALDALKEINPNTPEWDFVWNTLITCRLYFERTVNNKGKTDL